MVLVVVVVIVEMLLEGGHATPHSATSVSLLPQPHAQQ